MTIPVGSACMFRQRESTLARDYAFIVGHFTRLEKTHYFSAKPDKAHTVLRRTCFQSGWSEWEVYKYAGYMEFSGFAYQFKYGEEAATEYSMLCLLQ